MPHAPSVGQLTTIGPQHNWRYSNRGNKRWSHFFPTFTSLAALYLCTANWFYERACVRTPTQCDWYSTLGRHWYCVSTHHRHLSVILIPSLADWSRKQQSIPLLLDHRPIDSHLHSLPSTKLYSYLSPHILSHNSTLLTTCHNLSLLSCHSIFCLPILPIPIQVNFRHFGIVTLPVTPAKLLLSSLNLHYFYMWYPMVPFGPHCILDFAYSSHHWDAWPTRRTSNTAAKQDVWGKWQL